MEVSVAVKALVLKQHQGKPKWRRTPGIPQSRCQGNSTSRLQGPLSTSHLLSWGQGSQEPTTLLAQQSDPHPWDLDFSGIHSEARGVGPPPLWLLSLQDTFSGGSGKAAEFAVALVFVPPVSPHLSKAHSTGYLVVVQIHSGSFYLHIKSP